MPRSADDADQGAYPGTAHRSGVGPVQEVPTGPPVGEQTRVRLSRVADGVTNASTVPPRLVTEPLGPLSVSTS